VVVTNARGVLDRPIAEFVLGSILAFAKDPHRSHDLPTHRIEHRETLTIAGGNVPSGGNRRDRPGDRPAAARGGYGCPRRGTNRTRLRQDLGAVVLSSDLAADVGWGRYARNELAGQDVVEE
jgi:hypothetical protein